MEITKEFLQSKSACSPSYKWVVENKLIGLEHPEFIAKLMENNRFSDANWLITKLFDKMQSVKYAIFAAEQVLNIYEKKYPNDDRPRLAIEAAKKYLTNPNAKTADDAAYAADAAAAADAAYDAAYDADADAYAAYAADAADAAAYAAAAHAADAYAAGAAGADAADAADAAADAADAYAAYAAARAAYADADAAYAAYAADRAAAGDIKTSIINFGLELLK